MSEIQGKRQKEHQAIKNIAYEAQKAARNISFKTLIIVYLLIVLGLGLTVPKIYLRASIYYLSKDISALYAKYQVLEEENRYLRQQLEATKFKNQVLDTIF
jgi:cell division protein FtsL